MENTFSIQILDYAVLSYLQGEHGVSFTLTFLEFNFFLTVTALCIEFPVCNDLVILRFQT